MTKSNKVAAIIMGAAAGVALYNYFTMPKVERREFCSHLKDRTMELLGDAENTVEKVNHFMGEMDHKGENEWIDKLYLLKSMFRELYGSEKKFLL